MKELEQIARWTKKNYTDLPQSTVDNKKLIIFATGNFSGEYGYGSADLEGWGVDKDGKFFWVFASGCSCSTNAGVEEKTFKIFELQNVYKQKIESTDLLEKIELFKKDKMAFKKSILSYEYESS